MISIPDDKHATQPQTYAALPSHDRQRGSSIRTSSNNSTDRYSALRHSQFTDLSSSYPARNDGIDYDGGGGTRDSSNVPPTAVDTNNESIRSHDIIVQSFAPNIAVCSSTDTTELIKEKGFANGLTALLRPFGERVRGQVVIRDSQGISRSWDDYRVRFQQLESLRLRGNIIRNNAERVADSISLHDQTVDEGGRVESDAIIEQFLDSLRPQMRALENKDMSDGNHKLLFQYSEALFSKYLRTLLSNDDLNTYETFNHPVTCLIAVSSRNEAPIETLRQLYAMTGAPTSAETAVYATNILRYYVLVHDEDRDDIAKSVALFDLMKRHFGLHCHLLRLRSLRCAASDDDSVSFPRSQWNAAAELRASMQHDEFLDELQAESTCVFDSDIGAINTLIREMVTQSIIPFMEGRVTSWNDQIASRRRGLGGRFMTISKRWAGLASSKAANGAGNGTNGSNSSNYNNENGSYVADSPEMTLRYLGDYAMMLRDWRLAHSTYESVRSDYSHDGAWAFHAAANEMAAVSYMLSATTPNRNRTDIDDYLNASTYSYLTRCSLPTNTKRCLTLATALLSQKGFTVADHAASWAVRLLELSVLGSLEQTLTAQRIASMYGSVSENVRGPKGQRRRHTALWAILVSKMWWKVGRSALGKTWLSAARSLYTSFAFDPASLPFKSMLPLHDIVSHELGAQGLMGISSLGYEGLDSRARSDTDEARTDIQIGTFITDAELAPGNLITRSSANRPDGASETGFDTSVGTDQWID